jgi:hypothetical protein
MCGGGGYGYSPLLLPFLLFTEYKEKFLMKKQGYDEETEKMIQNIKKQFNRKVLKIKTEEDELVEVFKEAFIAKLEGKEDEYLVILIKCKLFFKTQQKEKF